MNREANDKFMLRLPSGWREKIKREAEKSERSMNAEIVFQLKRAYGANEKERSNGLVNPLRSQ
ncbi:Arc family DNA-binding protein [Ochrobactrum sp. A-1]|uniref:Arc family DNA-binding protein n=1 Tax=Ochrobactrum sp. A-1 TaxID=2920940 RepID=UPI001F0A4221|nr:Arc family DNA-binding protein [Ochrobactrum sp. A-1]